MSDVTDDESIDLAERECIPCKGGVPPLEGRELKGMLDALGGEWTVVDGHHLEKIYHFDNFRQALAFTNRVGELAEEQGHLEIWTHKIDGLHDSDFILAAKADRLA
jgi:4a-hydroxytetrahydrobiopterin dehydratase